MSMSKHSAFEGYHVWINNVLMTVKMVIQLLIGLMVVHSALIIVICWKTAGPVCVLGLKYLFYAFTNFRPFDPATSKPSTPPWRPDLDRGPPPH